MKMKLKKVNFKVFPGVTSDALGDAKVQLVFENGNTVDMWFATNADWKDVIENLLTAVNAIVYSE